MEIFDGHRALLRPLDRPAVAIGVFDGVHIGHRALIDRARENADERDADTVVLTFDPHPAAVLAPDRAPQLLCPVSRRLELIAAAGADVCIVEPFTADFANQSPEQFTGDILQRALGAKHVVVGYDFAFGKGRAGRAGDLAKYGESRGFTAEVVDAVGATDTAASSSAIRAAIRAGDLASARAMLGRHYDVDGIVMHGAARGRELGYPTANLDTAAAGFVPLLPPLGIYAVFARLLDQPDHPVVLGAASLGTNPTFGAAAPTLEVHLLDFSGDIYDQRVRCEFVELLRPEQRFDGIEALVEQIGADVAKARTILRHEQ